MTYIKPLSKPKMSKKIVIVGAGVTVIIAGFEATEHPELLGD